MELTVGSRLKHAWNAFLNRAPTANYQYGIGGGYAYRPDRFRLTRGNERSIVTSVYNRIALDVAAINIQHVQLDDEGRFLNVIKSGLNDCLSLEANLDQTGRAFIQDVVMSMMDEGVVAIVPVDTTIDPDISNGFDITSMRVGKVVDWYPQHVKLEVYNEQTGIKQNITMPKRSVAIIENPLYAVINEPNSTMQRLVRKLNLLDAVDEQSSSGKLDLIMYAEENALQHDATSSGVATGDLSKLFPEYAEVRPGAPELITNDQGWISTVISKVHKSPMSRIRTTQADIRNIDTLKAHGYQKGKQKKLAGNFNLVRRTTDPQTIYVKNALNRDDIVDITDFDYVAYLYSIDRMNLNEELATAIMIGDGRDDGAEDKIFPEHIRPIWTDDDLYTIHVDLDITAMKAELQGTNTGVNFGDNYVYAEAMVQTILYARENYKGTLVY